MAEIWRAINNAWVHSPTIEEHGYVGMHLVSSTVVAQREGNGDAGKTLATNSLEPSIVTKPARRLAPGAARALASAFLPSACHAPSATAAALRPRLKPFSPCVLDDHTLDGTCQPNSCYAPWVVARGPRRCTGRGSTR